MYIVQSTYDNENTYYGIHILFASCTILYRAYDQSILHIYSVFTENGIIILYIWEYIIMSVHICKSYILVLYIIYCTFYNRPHCGLYDI